MTAFERASAQRCREVLSRYPRVIAAPASLDLSLLQGILEPDDIIRFSDDHFRSTRSYSALLRGPHFYDLCPDWVYALIYQLDSFVFLDELEFWCGQDIDYVGAPWPNFDWVGEGRHAWLRHLPIPWSRLGEVGNGGFSLRRLSTFRRLSRKWQVPGKFINVNEDLYWSWVMPILEPSFQIPPAHVARAFAVELAPSEEVSKAGRLPFGCHAFERYEPEFWMDLLDSQNRSSPDDAG
ncbi:MAG: DUF5672 family protein [Gemmatimonadota bacterium]